MGDKTQTYREEQVRKAARRREAAISFATMASAWRCRQFGDYAISERIPINIEPTVGMKKRGWMATNDCEMQIYKNSMEGSTKKTKSSKSGGAASA
jgi:hypothetical protein